jgi:hypothetical protein
MLANTTEPAAKAQLVPAGETSVEMVSHMAQEPTHAREKTTSPTSSDTAKWRHLGLEEPADRPIAHATSAAPGMLTRRTDKLQYIP